MNFGDISWTMVDGHVLVGEHEEDDGTIEVELPWRYEVCGYCGGHGGHSRHLGVVDPRLMSEEELEDYSRGGYDVECEVCHGRRVVPEILVDRLGPDEREAYSAYRMQVAEYRDSMRQQAAELRMEAGDPNLYLGPGL